MKQLILSAAVLFTLCLFTASTSSQVNTYTVTNSSGMVVTGVSLSPNDANNWGLNLNSTGNITSNGTFTFSQSIDPANCLYDVRYMGEDGTYYYVQDVNMCTTKSLTLPAPVRDSDKNMKK
jgi:hypothetical protein